MDSTKTDRRRPTIVDVARAAGVSTSTASKVLRKETYGLSASARSCVDQAILDLDYRPLAAARGMRGKTFTVGVLTPDVSNPYFAMIAEGLIASLQPSSYEMLIGPAGPDAESHQRVIDAMLDRQMDGLLLISPLIGMDRLAHAARSAPTVVLGQHGRMGSFDTIAGDDLTGAKLVIDHLVELGHRDIAYVANREAGGDPDWRHPILRERGYREAMETHGLYSHINVVHAEWNRNGGKEAVNSLLNRGSLPTAIFAGADVVAFGVLHELHERGCSVPDDVSVVGFDNTPMSSLAPLGLTSVDQQGVRIGELAGRMLLERIDGRTEPAYRLLDTTLVPRSSSAPPRSDT